MELVDVLNERKEKNGKVCDRNGLCEGEFRLSVHIWIINNNNEILLQKRNRNLKVYPGMWGNTGGAAKAGESSLEAIKREVKEELGLTIKSEKMIFIASFKRSKDFVDVWLLKDDIKVDDIKLQENEVEAVKFINRSTFNKLYENREIIQSSTEYFKMYMDKYMN